MQPLLKIQRYITLLASLFGFVLNAQTVIPPEAEVVEFNGDFETVSEHDNWPDGWSKNDGIILAEEANGNHYIRFDYREPDELISTTRHVSISPNQRAFHFSCRARYENIAQGSKQWHDGRVIFNFLDADGKRISSPSPPYFKRTSNGWITKHAEFLVPEGAESLEIILALFKVKSGTLDFDDLSLYPIPSEPLKARIAAREAERLADQKRRAALVKPQIERPTNEEMPAKLKVVGNQILDTSGDTVWLHGLSVPSLEWVSNGEHIFESIRNAVTEWNANVIRLPVSEVFWVGKGPYQKDGGAGYRQHIEDAANLCASLGVYMILDLHYNGIPTEKHSDFWIEASERFKNHPSVLFEVFNNANFPDKESWRFKIQTIVNAIRTTGADNILIVAGSNQLELEDASGDGIIYSFHLYPKNADIMDSVQAFATRHPVFVTELGAWTSESEHVSSNREWAAQVFPWLNEQKIHWAAWCFHPLARPRMLTDWDYQPSPHWGNYVKDALLAEKTE
jgi:Cellulase (glycosyl hydrolase family 5).